MAQGQVQVQSQEQTLKQTQMFSQQQLLQAQLVELPVTQLLERINTEMNDNPALEVASGDEQPDWKDDALTGEDAMPSEEDFDIQSEREERQSALDDALAGIGRDDEDLPVYHGGMSTQEEREEMVYGDTVSFYDLLKEQMGETELTATEAEVMEYLIGSLDDDGLLRKDLDAISDELAIYYEETAGI